MYKALRLSRRLWFALALAAAVAAGCNKSSTTEVQPTPVKCAVALAVSPGVIPPGGGAASITVTTTAECAWSAAAEAPWITGVTPPAGQGAAEVGFVVMPNPEARTREGQVNLNGTRAMVRQEAAACAFTAAPVSHSLPVAGGNGTVNVTTLGGCGWTATASATWITVLTGAAGTESGAVTFRVAANTGLPRVGTITIGTQVVTIAQDGVTPPSPVPCTFAIEPPSAAPAAGGASQTVTVTAPPTCPWTATSQAVWITIASGATGAGTGPVTLTVAANSGPARSGTALIAGQTFTVNQAGGCAFSIVPPSRTVPAAGGASPPVSLTAPAGCAWTATSQAPWLTITSATSGTGSSTIGFTVAANSGPQRSGTLTIGGQLFTVTQESGCAVAINPTSRTVPASGGPSTPPIEVTAAAGCGWTAASQADWLTITAGASGTGNGSVEFSVAAHAGAQRTGALTIGGRTFTVTQQSGCAVTIAPASRTVPAAGGPSTPAIAVTAAAGCAWTATRNDPWLTITAGASGTGNGSVEFSVAANAGPERIGTLTIGGQTFTVTQQGGCAVTINPTSRTVPAAGGPSTPPIAVTAPGGCTWTATSQVAWLTITAGASGTGNGSVEFSVAANAGPERIGTLTIGGQTFTVTQQGGCAVTIAPASRTVPAAGGPSTPPITVTAPAGCTWTATRNDPWLTITAGASGTGPGSVEFSVAANAGPERIGTLTIGGQTFTVTQQGGCAVTINPTSRTVPAAGGPSTPPIAVTAPAGCTWTATRNDPWLTITAGASGTGPGSVEFSVAANAGPERIGTLTIGGQTFTVTQQGGCTVTINPTSRTVPAAGGPSTPPIAVTAPGGCTWTATRNDPWLTITAGASGTGPGSVEFSVAANAGPERIGTLTIGGQTFTVTQQGGCTVTINPTSRTVPAAAGPSTPPIAVTAPGGCTWTATRNDPWLTITAGASGTGPGNVEFSVAANAGPERIGTLTIGGQTFTVTQQSGCSVTINPSSRTVPAAGGPSTPPITVTAPDGCAWTAIRNDPWLTITAGATGTGNGNVEFSVAANAGPERIGTLTIGGQTFTVTQQSGCSVTINPTSRTVPAAGGPSTPPIAVTAPDGCAWTAIRNDPWLTITAGASGTGNGSVEFSVAANAGPERIGTLTIGGQTFTVTQQSGCSVTINPTSRTVPAAGGPSTPPIAVTAPAGCNWTATRNDPWLTITAGATGTGPGSVEFTVAANAGPERIGTLTIGGQTFTVTQQSGCNVTINPTSRTVPAAGGPSTPPIAVTAPAGCTWTAIRNDPWLTITAGASGTGPGSVEFSVAANAGPERIGTLTIGGQTFTVTQQSGCNYSLDLTSVQFNDNAHNNQRIRVFAPAGCTWTAVSQVAWITIRSGASGSGNGEVRYDVAANPGSPRVGTIIVAGITFTVNQDDHEP